MKRLICRIFGHDWTSRILEGDRPSNEELRSAIAEGRPREIFDSYFHLRCKRCGMIKQRQTIFTR